MDTTRLDVFFNFLGGYEMQLGNVLKLGHLCSSFIFEVAAHGYGRHCSDTSFSQSLRDVLAQAQGVMEHLPSAPPRRCRLWCGRRLGSGGEGRLNVWHNNT